MSRQERPTYHDTLARVFLVCLLLGLGLVGLVALLFSLIF